MRSAGSDCVRHLNLDVIVSRGAAIEAHHVVHAAVCDAHGTLIAQAGDPETVSPWRSCAKPFQVFPMVASGAFDSRGWAARELALACASHGGEPEHTELASSMLSSLGLTEESLACGPHTPLSERGASLLAASGCPPTRLHNNCSGKHSAMLGAAVAQGEPTRGYHDPQHPLQRALRSSLAPWTGVAAGALDVAVDGCGVPVFILTVRQMALAYARLADAAAQDGPAARILSAMTTHPFLVGGTDRFDTILMEETRGAVVAKVGAEGVHSFLLRDRGLGLTIKVGDGSSRAQYPAVVRALQYMDALPAELPARLHNILVAPVHDTNGNVVGQIRPAA
jgi:L-asparaginase II